MSLSRKRKRELNKLRSQAEALLDEQRSILDSAGSLAQQAGRQAKHLSDEVVAPRINEALEGVRPTIDRSVSAARRAGAQARLFIAPFLATALANTISGLERIENKEAADAAQQLQLFGVRQGLLKKPKRRGIGRAFAIGAGIVAAGAVAYTLWQAFRSDDELWVAPEDLP